MNKNKRTILLMAGAALLVVAVIVGIAISSITGRGSEKVTLEQYYRGMYVEGGGGIPAVIDCILPAAQQDYYNTITNGGTNFMQLGAWYSEARSMVGDGVQVDVELYGKTKDNASQLAQVRSEYGHEVEAYHVVSFKMTLSGSVATEEFYGVMPMLRIDGTWYLMSIDADFHQDIEE